MEYKKELLFLINLAQDVDNNIVDIDVAVKSVINNIDKSILRSFYNGKCQEFEDLLDTDEFQDSCIYDLVEDAADLLMI